MILAQPRKPSSVNAVESLFDLIHELSKYRPSRRSLARARRIPPVLCLETWVLRGKFVHQHKGKRKRQHAVTVHRQAHGAYRLKRKLNGDFVLQTTPYFTDVDAS